MTTKQTNPNPQSTQKAALAGLGLGCLVPSLVLIIAVLVGLWLDSTLENSKHLYTIGFIIVSVPLTAVILVWGTRSLSRKMNISTHQADTPKDFLQEDADSDAD